MPKYTPEEWAEIADNYYPVLDEEKRVYSGNENDSFWGDVGTQINLGTTVDLPRQAMGIADFASNGRASAYFNPSLEEREQTLSADLRPSTQEKFAAYDRNIAEAAKNGMGAEAVATLSGMMDPEMLALKGARSAPSTAAMLIPGGFAAKGARDAVFAAAAAKNAAAKAGVESAINGVSRHAVSDAAVNRAANRAASSAAATGAALGEGALGAGGSMNQMVEENIEEGRPLMYGAGAALGVGAGTALITRGAGKLVSGANKEAELATVLGGGRYVGNVIKPKVGAPQSLLGKAVHEAGDLLKSAAQEGLLEEMPQGILETALPNLAQGKPVTEGMAQNAIESGMIGAAMGGGMHMLSRPFRQNPAQPDQQGQGTPPTQPPAGPKFSAQGNQVVDNRPSLDPSRQTAVNLAAADQPLNGRPVPTGQPTVPPTGMVANTQPAQPVQTPEQQSAPGTEGNAIIDNILDEIEAEEQAQQQAKSAQQEKEAGSQIAADVASTFFPRSTTPDETGRTRGRRLSPDRARAFQETQFDEAGKGQFAQVMDEANEETRSEKGSSSMRTVNNLVEQTSNLLNGAKDLEEVRQRADKKANEWITSADSAKRQQAQTYKYAALRLKNPEASPKEIKGQISDWVELNKAASNLAGGKGKKGKSPSASVKIHDDYGFNDYPRPALVGEWTKAKKNLNEKEQNDLVGAIKETFASKGDDAAKRRSVHSERVLGAAVAIAKQYAEHKKIAQGNMANPENGTADRLRHFFDHISQRDEEMLEKVGVTPEELNQIGKKFKKVPTEPDPDDFDMFFPQFFLSPEDRAEIARDTGSLEYGPEDMTPEEEERYLAAKQRNKSSEQGLSDTNAEYKEDKPPEIDRAINEGTFGQSEDFVNDIELAREQSARGAARLDESASEGEEADNEGNGSYHRASQESRNTQAARALAFTFKQALGKAMHDAGIQVDTQRVQKRAPDGRVVMSKGQPKTELVWVAGKNPEKRIAKEGKADEVKRNFNKFLPEIFVALCQHLYNRVKATSPRNWDSWNENGIPDLLGDVYAVAKSNFEAVGGMSETGKFGSLLFDLYRLASQMPINGKVAPIEAARAQILSRLSPFVAVAPAKELNAEGEVAQGKNVQRRTLEKQNESLALAKQRAAVFLTKDSKKEVLSGEALEKRKFTEKQLDDTFGKGDREAFEDVPFDEANTIKEGDKELDDRSFFNDKRGEKLTLDETTEYMNYYKQYVKGEAGESGKRRIVKGEASAKLGRKLANVVLKGTFFPSFLRRGEKLGWYKRIKSAVGDVQHTFTGDFVAYFQKIPNPLEDVSGVRSLVRKVIGNERLLSEEPYKSIRHSDLKPYKERLGKVQSGLRASLLATIARDPEAFYHAYRMGLKKLTVYGDFQKGSRMGAIREYDRGVREYVEAAALKPEKKAEIFARLDEMKDFVQRRIETEELSYSDPPSYSNIPGESATTKEEMETAKQSAEDTLNKRPSEAVIPEPKVNDVTPAKTMDAIHATNAHMDTPRTDLHEEGRKWLPNAMKASESGKNMLLDPALEPFLDSPFTAKKLVADIMDEFTPDADRVANGLTDGDYDYGYWVIKETAGLVGGVKTTADVRKRAEYKAAHYLLQKGDLNALKAMHLKYLAEKLKHPSGGVDKAMSRAKEWVQKTGRFSEKVKEGLSKETEAKSEKAGEPEGMHYGPTPINKSEASDAVRKKERLRTLRAVEDTVYYDHEYVGKGKLDELENSTADPRIIDDAVFIYGGQGGVAVPLDTAAQVLRDSKYSPSSLTGVFSEATAIVLADGVEMFDKLGWVLPKNVVITDGIRTSEDSWKFSTTMYQSSYNTVKGDAIRKGSDGVRKEVTKTFSGGRINLRIRPYDTFDNKFKEDYELEKNLTVRDLKTIDFIARTAAFHEFVHAIIEKTDLPTKIGESLAKLGSTPTELLSKYEKEDSDLGNIAEHAIESYKRGWEYYEYLKQAGQIEEAEKEKLNAEKKSVNWMGNEFFTSVLPFWLENFSNIREELSKPEWDTIRPYFEGVNDYVRSLDVSSSNIVSTNAEASTPSTERAAAQASNSNESSGGTTTNGKGDASSTKNVQSVPGKSGTAQNGDRGSAPVSSSNPSNGNEAGPSGQGNSKNSIGPKQQNSTVVLQQGSGKSVLPPQGDRGPSGDGPSSRSVEVTAADSILESTPEKFKPVARTVINLFGGKGLMGMFTRNLVETFSSLVPSAKTWWHHVEAMMQERSKLQQDAADVAERFSRLSKHEQERTNQLLLDSTVNKFWAFRDKRVFPSEEEWKSYLNSFNSKDLAEYKRFLRRYNGLSTAAKQSFAEVINAGTQEKLTLAEIQKQAAYDSLGLRKTNMDAAHRKKLQAQYDEKCARIDSELKRALANPYVSLGRQGDHVVTYRSPKYMAVADAYEKYKTQLAQPEHKITDKERKVLQRLKDQVDDLATSAEDYKVEFYESALDANKRYYELKKQYPNNPEESIQTFEKAMYIGAQMPKWASFAEIIRQISKNIESENGTGSIKEEDLYRLSEAANEVYIQSLSDTSAKKSELRRRIIPGYNDDMLENYVQHAKKMSHLIASMNHSWDIHDALDTASKEAKNQAYAGKRDQATLVVNELRRRQGQIFAPNSSPTAGKVMRTTSLWMLLTNPAFYLQNLLQPGMMSAPYINGQLGINCLGELVRTMKQVAELVTKDMTLRNLKNVLNEDEYKALMRARDRQLLTIGVTSELGEVGDNTALGKTTNWLTRKAQTVEVINRVSTHLVAYRNAIAKGYSKEKAAAFAERTIEQTHGDYSKENAPSFFNMNAFTKTATQFRKFQFIQAGMVYRMLRDSARKDLSPAERAIARRQLMWIMGTHFAMAGLKGTPIVAQIMALSGLVMGMGGSGDDDEDLIRKTVKDKDVSDFLLKGIPMLLGVDMSKKVGAGDMMNPLPFFEYDATKGKRNAGDLAYNLAGPWASLGGKVMEGAKFAFNGDYAKALEQVLPYGLLSNSVKAMRLESEGFTNSAGDVLIKPKDMGLLSSLATAMGLSPRELSSRTALQGSIIRHDSTFSQAKSRIQREYNEAKASRDYKGMAKAIKSLGELNQHRKNAGYTTIPRSQLDSTYKQKVNRERNARGGVVTSKQNHRFVEQMSQW